MYVHSWGVTSPLLEHLWMLGQTPQGILTRPGDGRRDCIDRYSLFPSGITVFSAFPSYTSVLRIVSRSSMSRDTWKQNKSFPWDINPQASHLWKEQAALWYIGRLPRCQLQSINKMAHYIPTNLIISFPKLKTIYFMFKYVTIFCVCYFHHFTPEIFCI